MDATDVRAHPPKWITLGHPSYVWRFGQDRRLALVLKHVDLKGKRILDVGCGTGTYVRKFKDFSDDVYGVDIDPEKISQARLTAARVTVAPAEALPFPDGFFDVVFLHEVIEHVGDDQQAVAEAVRVTAPGGSVVIYAPNRLYLFETHGIYLGRRYVFRLIPFVNYLPDRLRRVFCPHVRAYGSRQIKRLFDGLPVRLSVHTYVYPGFDNIFARSRRVAGVLRRLLYYLEGTPLRVFGLSHFIVVEKVA